MLPRSKLSVGGERVERPLKHQPAPAAKQRCRPSERYPHEKLARELLSSAARQRGLGHGERSSPVSERALPVTTPSAAVPLRQPPSPRGGPRLPRICRRKVSQTLQMQASRCRRRCFGSDLHWLQVVPGWPDLRSRARRQALPGRRAQLSASRLFRAVARPRRNERPGGRPFSLPPGSSGYLRNE